MGGVDFTAIYMLCSFKGHFLKHSFFTFLVFRSRASAALIFHLCLLHFTKQRLEQAYTYIYKLMGFFSMLQRISIDL